MATKITTETENAQESNNGVQEPTAKEETAAQAQEEVEESEEESSGDSEEKKAPAMSQEELEFATQLITNLKDPEKARITVQNLANSLGVKIAQEEKKVEEGKKGSTVQEIIDKHLPERYKALAPIFHGMFEDFSSLVMEPKFAKSDQEKIVERSTTALAKIQSKYKDYKSVESEMDRISNMMPPNISMMKTQKDFDFYLEALYKAAGGSGKSTASAVASTVDKMKRNARGSGITPSDSGNRDKSGSARPSIREAVQAALEGREL